MHLPIIIRELYDLAKLNHVPRTFISVEGHQLPKDLLLMALVRLNEFGSCITDIDDSTQAKLHTYLSTTGYPRLNDAQIRLEGLIAKLVSLTGLSSLVILHEVKQILNHTNVIEH